VHSSSAIRGAIQTPRIIALSVTESDGQNSAGRQIALSAATAAAFHAMEFERRTPACWRPAKLAL
jgi:hypothetical protein